MPVGAKKDSAWGGRRSGGFWEDVGFAPFGEQGEELDLVRPEEDHSTSRASLGGLSRGPGSQRVAEDRA